jgi:hypothetical protein
MPVCKYLIICKLEMQNLRECSFLVQRLIDFDTAIKEATINLQSWLQKDYHLCNEEASQVIGSSVFYTAVLCLAQNLFHFFSFRQLVH